MRRTTACTSHQVRGLAFEVEGKLLVCSNCGFQMVPADLLEEHGLLVDKAYRHAAGLLRADEIRDARKRLGLSQLEFAEYLGVGEASVKRWEAGALQDKSSDDLIRLKTDPKFAQENLEQLCRRLGRRSPTEPERELIFVAGQAGFRRPRFSWTTETPINDRSGEPFVFPDTALVN
ncbi:MAG: helix-turn-helix domain-containing protein [Bryobacteraceae bacterium]|nr:helix-turn-helix domain-containing protein [Bryobacteraceae bacterium]